MRLASSDDRWGLFKANAMDLTAFRSPIFPDFAKCALKVAFELPAATPHKALRTPESVRIPIRTGFGNAGDRQSNIMAESLNTSAANLYILHSG